MSSINDPREAGAPTRRPRRWGRRIVKVLLALVVLVALLPFALRLGFVRDALADALARRVGKPVRIGSISGWYAQGFRIEDLVIESGEGFAEPLLSVPSAEASVAWGRLLGGNLDVTVRVTRPELVIQVREDGTTNLAGLLADEGGPPPARRESGSGFDIALLVEDATVRVPDATRSTVISPIRLDAGLRGGRLHGEASAVLPAAGVGGGDVTLVATLPAATGGGPQMARLKTSEAIDLATLKVLVERVAGIELVAGHVLVDAEAEVDDGEVGKATGHARATDLWIRDAAGGAVRAASIELRVDAPTRAEGQLDATFERVEVTRPQADGPPLVFQEPRVTAAAHWARAAEGGTRIEVASLEAGSSAEVSLAEPFVLPAAGETWSAGRVRARADLARLAPLLGAWPVLERLRGGTVLAQAVAERGVDGRTVLAIGVALDQLALGPGPAGEPAVREPRVEAQLRWLRGGDEERIELVRLVCSALRTDDAMLNKPLVLVHGAEHTYAAGVLDADVTLGAASAWLRALGHLAPTDDISGTVDLELAVDADQRTGRMRGQAVGRDVLWRTHPSDPGWRESALRVAFDVSLPTASAPGRAHALSVESSGLEVRADGATWRSEPEAEVDATLTIGGDANRLAGLVQRALGAGYEDLTASGTLGGQVTIRGVPGNGGRLLLVDGMLRLASWRTQGLALDDVEVRIVRAQPTAPLVTDVAAKANGGTVAARLGVDLANSEKPWTFEADLAGIDTSPLVTNRGAGRYLAFAVPALLPADAATPALSGRLEAQVRMRAAALAAPRRDDTLQGTATVRLTEGEIRNSTLFRGEKMGSALQAIAVAVPEAGRALKGLAQALLFTSVESELAIGSRRVDVKLLNLAGRNARINGRGQVGFDERVAMDVDLTLEGKLLARVAKEGALPLQVRGTLGQPQVVPRIDLAALVGGGVAKDAVDRVRDLLGK